MDIGHIQKLSLVDYPGKLSMIIWTQGCNFLCPYCHNPKLVRKELDGVKSEYIFDLLEKRSTFLEGVSISGGEPTLQEDIIEFIRKVNDLGFSVKLDTNGSKPQVVSDLLEEELLDYIAMDIKAPKDKYPALTGKKVKLDKIERSIELIKRSQVKHEFRTTVVPEYISEEDIKGIAKWVGEDENFYLQKYQDDVKMIDENFLKSKCQNYTEGTLKNWSQNYFEEGRVRRGK